MLFYLCTHDTRPRLLAQLTLIGLVWFAWPIGEIQAQNCAAIYRQKKYLTAASCFLKSARKMGRTSRLKAALRLKKGGLLRNAAVSFMKAATQAGKANERTYLQERAMYILRSYDGDRLCASPERCAAAKRQSQKLYRAIRYARLSLIFPKVPVAVQVSGFRYRTTKILKRSPWRLRLRPGRYHIALIGLGQQQKIGTLLLSPSAKKSWTYRPSAAPPPQRTSALPPRRVRPPNRRAVVTRQPTPRPVARRKVLPRPVARRPVTRRPVTRRVIARREPTPRPQIRPRSTPTSRGLAAGKTTPTPQPKRGTPGAATALYVIGGVALAAGIGVTGYAIYAHSEGTAKYNDPGATLGDAQALKSAYDTTLPISITLLAVGAASLAVGGILHVALKPAPRAPHATTPRAHTLWRSETP